MRFFTGCLILFLPSILHAQTLHVFSRATEKPVENVYLYTHNFSISALTDAEGKARLEAFHEKDTIYFQHTSFSPVAYTKNELAALGYRIYLDRRVRTLDEFVISVYRWEQDRREMPRKITSVKEAEVRLMNPQTTADLLGTTGEVFIQKSQLGGGSPMIRGFAANSVLLVVDGVRMNNAIYRSGNLQNVISLDPNIIETSEVIFGPGSVVYGSDAMGGVMGFHTRTVNLSTGKGPRFSVRAMTRYSTANREKTGHLSLNAGFEKWGFLTGISYHRFSDLRMGNIGHEEYLRKEYVVRINGTDSIIKNESPNIQKFSGYDQLNITQKIRYRAGNHLNLVYGFHYSRLSDVPRYDRLIQYRDGKLRFAEWYYGPQKWIMNHFQAEYDRSTPCFDRARLVVAHQGVEESRNNRKLNDTRLNSQVEHVDVYNLNLDMEKTAGQSNTFFYGLEAVYNQVASRASTRNILTGETVPAPTRYPDGYNHYHTFATYVSYKKNFSERFTLLAGLRYNRTGLHSFINDTSFYHLPFTRIRLASGALNGSTGLVFRPEPGWQFNLNAATGFRSPNLDDVGKVFESGDGVVVVPNPDLKPEYVYNIDLGIIRYFGENTRIDLTGFYSLVDGLMVRRDFLFNGQDTILYFGDPARVNALVNAESATIAGATLSVLAGVTPHLSLRSGFTWMTGKTSAGEPVRHVAPPFGNMHILYQKERIKTDMYVRFNLTKPYTAMSPSEIDKAYLYAKDADGNPYSPGWYTLNIKTSFTLRHYLEIDLGIENLLNHRYRPYSSGIVAPGRNLIIAARLCI
ncbi:MAG TPA: TonB-dependent receptor [Bacteroidetes bacterium]|nr:TonB-dependent receptor [Bacteroidota bacterium]